MNIIGDEYHVFFECPNANISLQRNRFTPTYFRQNRSIFNFVKLLQSVDDIKVGRCVIFCNQLKYCVMSMCE